MPPEQLTEYLEGTGILGGWPLNGDMEGCILWCATECNSKEEMDTLVELVRGRVG